jgi:RNA polymerase sigma factor (sigma-70 family)
MKQDKYTDQEITEGILHQNKDVLLFIYKHNFRSILKYIEDNNGAESDAEDVFQDTLIVIFEKIRKNELKLSCSFGTFLYAIAKHQWLRILRQRQIHEITDNDCDTLINEDPGITDNLILAEKKKLVIQHLNEISEECKKIIKYMSDGCTLDEITKTMGYSSVQQTKNRKLKCKKFLITSIMCNPRFKELANGKIGENYQIPRW